MFWVEPVIVFFGIPMAMGFAVSLLTLAIAWGGRRVGMLFGILGLVSGFVGMAGLLLTAPQLWWLAVVPIGVGAAAARTWYHRDGPVTARPLRFDLRGVFMLIFVVALILVGATSEYRQTNIEKEVAAQLGMNPNVVVRWKFDRVHGVHWVNPLDPLPAEDFEHVADGLQQLAQLHHLQIGGRNLPATIIERVGRLTSLRGVELQTIPVMDDDLRPLANLRNLETLGLDASRLTDAGLVHLKGLKRLRLLHLYDAKYVSPEAMARQRAELPRLDSR